MANLIFNVSLCHQPFYTQIIWKLSWKLLKMDFKNQNFEFYPVKIYNSHFPNQSFLQLLLLKIKSWQFEISVLCKTINHFVELSWISIIKSKAKIEMKSDRIFANKSVERKDMSMNFENFWLGFEFEILWVLLVKFGILVWISWYIAGVVFWPREFKKFYTLRCVM
jgi:hypothetical protein